MERKRQKISTAVVLLILLVPVLYLLFQLYSVLNRPYVTETAIRYDMSDSLYLDGFLVFDQQEVPGDGMLGYLVENGMRVSGGTQVAEQYTDPSQADARRELRELDEQMELLKKSENTVTNDVSVLLSQRQSSFYDFLDELDRQNYEQAEKEAKDYLLALNRLQITTGQIRNFSSARSELEQQRQSASERLGSPGAVNAPVGGYFVAAPSGDWLEFDNDQFSEMSAETIQSAFEDGNGIRPMEGAGKLVKSYTWRFYGTCPVSEMKRFEGVKTVELSFPGEAEKPLPAVVESVTAEEGAKLAKIVLRCEYVGADVLGLSSASARIDFNSYKGIRVNAKALHIVDGEKGVYVKYGNLARWRKIKAIYQDDEYILVPEGGKVGTENEVRLFDEIIVEGVDLKDGKLLK